MASIFGRISLILMILGCLNACRRPDPNPELSDPIYLDLLSETKATNSAVENLKKEVEEQKKKIAELPPRDSSRSHMNMELYKKEKNLVQLQQMAQYFEIRQQQRKEHIQIEYPKIFEANKPWPVPEDVEAFKKFKELRSASRNWEDRVPKTNRYKKKEN